MNGGANHPNDLTCGLNGGPSGGYLMGKPLTSEFQGGPPFGRWWENFPLGICVDKLSLVQCILLTTNALVVIKVVTYCGTSLLSLLMINETTLITWTPIVCGVCIGVNDDRLF